MQNHCNAYFYGNYLLLYQHVKIRKSSLILLMITLYGANYFIFERILFFNEILSLLGFIYFVKFSIREGGRFFYPKNTIYRCVLLFITLCSLYAIASLPFKTSWYYYFRNLSIIYSVFTFFLGYHLYYKQFDFFNRVRKAIYGYALICFAIGAPGLIDRNAYSFWFSLLQRNWKLVSVVMFILLHILYVLSYTSLTVIMILGFIIGVRFFIKTYLQFKIALAFGFFSFLVVFLLAMPYLKLYGQGGYSLFGNALYVYSHHPWFWIDPNSSWRLIFWYRSVVENFPGNLLGSGVGTPLLPYLENINTTGLPFNDEYIAHVIGTHNTFVTVLARFGIVSLLLLALIYRSVFREFFKYKQYYIQNKNDLGLFLGFLTLTAVGLFNLVIESPTIAGLFWVSLGFVSRAIQHRQQTIPSTAPINPLLQND